MPSEMVEEMKRKGYSSGGQANVLSWVLALGRTVLGWEALQSLFEVVDLKSERGAASFFECCTGNGDTPWHFAEVSQGKSKCMGVFIQHLRISFDISTYYPGMSPFRLNLTTWLPRFISMKSLTFDIHEWNDSHAFLLMTQPEMQYPISLHTVQMLSVSTDAAKVCVLCTTATILTTLYSSIGP